MSTRIGCITGDAVHLLTSSKPIPMGVFGELPSGQWLCHDQNAGQLMLTAQRGEAQLTYCPSELSHPEGEKNTLLLIRSGAIGDLLFLSPVIAALKVALPNTQISLSTFKKHHSVVCDLEIPLEDYPVALTTANKFARVIDLGDVLETCHDKHATDVFADRLGATITNYKPIFGLNEFERAFALTKFPKTRRKRVGIQPLASTPNRSYPLRLWSDVIDRLVWKNDCEVFLFGHKNQIAPIKIPHVTNLTEESLPIRHSAAVLTTCDVFCGVDSAMLPFCHALDVPAVGLYAAFDWRTRTAKAPKTVALTGVGDCAPCNWIKHAGENFPPGKPCSVGPKENRACVVLAGIKPERIVAKILSHASEN